jgi:hypothetical protein
VQAARIDQLQREITRLRALCREAGVNPEPAVAVDDTPSAESHDAPTVYTRREYDEITEGMTYRQVAETLGADGDRIASSQDNGAVNEVRVWVNPDDSHICLVFRNGVVLVKTQADLTKQDASSTPPVSTQD